MSVRSDYVASLGAILVKYGGMPPGDARALADAFEESTPYTSEAALLADAPANGSIGFAPDTGAFWFRRAGAWTATPNESGTALDWKGSVRAATTANVALTGAQTIDGVALIAGQRVLVKAQTAPAENGIYVVAAGAWARATDADVSADVTAGLAVFVEEGTVNADTGWILTTDGAITLGTTAVTFTQFTALGQITAGAGLTKTASTLDVVANADASIVVNANDIQVGVLATDAQHGARGGGTQHANVIAAGAAGFMTGADKTRLDGISAGADVTSTALAAASADISVNGQRITNSRCKVVDQAASAALATSASGSVQTNVGAAARVDLTLPAILAADIGANFTFCCEDTDGLRVVAPGGVTLQLGASASSAGGYAEATAVGSVLRLIAVSTTRWIAESVVNAWTTA